MNRTTEIHSQGLDNEGQNQKLTQQHSANGDGPRLVACVLLLPEDAEVLAGLLCNLATNSGAARCATNSWVSAGPGRAILPEFLPAATHPATAQRDDGVGAPDGPMHSGALESLSNDRFTACLDDARPNE